MLLSAAHEVLRFVAHMSIWCCCWWPTRPHGAAVGCAHVHVVRTERLTKSVVSVWYVVMTTSCEAINVGDRLRWGPAHVRVRACVNVCICARA